MGKRSWSAIELHQPSLSSEKGERAGQQPESWNLAAFDNALLEKIAGFAQD
jgi:hypothetical protein